MLYDGMNIRAEFARVCNLPCWHSAVRNRHPHLDIVMVKKGNVRTLGMARWQNHHIRLRIRVGRHTRYDIMETIVHEVAHIDAQHRENDAAKAENRTRQHISHGPEFWKSMDMGWAAAFPHAVENLGPRLSKYHGRYVKALKEAEGVLEPVKPKPIQPRVVRHVPGVVMWEEQPAASITPLIDPLGFLKPKPEFKSEPKILTPKERITTGMLDENVRLIVEELVWTTREEIQRKFEDHYGEYPGKSVYNSLWRLRRDGKVKRAGQHWTLT